MIKEYFTAADYDYKKTYPQIDYSEIVTEPGLCLSMREIFNRYAAAGVDLLSGQLESDSDDDPELHDFDPDDNLDVLQQASLLRQSAQDRTRSARRTKKATDKEPEKQEPPKQEDEPKQSEGKDSKQDGE